MNVSWWLSLSGGGAALGLLLGILGIVLTIRVLDRQLLAYTVETTPLIGAPGANLSDQVQVHYAGEPVPNLIRSNITVWNGGNATIRADDVASTDPIHLIMGAEQKILDVTAIAVSDPVNCFQSSMWPLKGDVSLSFEFLRPKDGGVVEVLHTGPDLKIELRGTLKGHRSKIKLMDLSKIDRSFYYVTAANLAGFFIPSLLFRNTATKIFSWVAIAVAILLAILMRRGSKPKWTTVRS
jgi:hypothetical protein